ncbi:unnamed protein product [Protopolystoma xenopodis]|uniref:Uncharacterized protein n=1 Tax=Protopolystoma xenopodis TaxID=117903 RepID=A0A3S5AXA2_9PLAT|nr:unnamed protein product [Protopolystoma xenopodis]
MWAQKKPQPSLGQTPSGQNESPSRVRPKCSPEDIKLGSLQLAETCTISGLKLEALLLRRGIHKTRPTAQPGCQIWQVTCPLLEVYKCIWARRLDE